jgi:hypothetical protein
MPASKRRNSTVRSYSDRVLKLLWGRAAGRCAMPECRIELFAEATDYDPVVVIGEIAHVTAAGKAGPRPAARTTAQKNDYPNLILLCRNCHGRIDKQVNSYSEERLQDIKQAHEAWVRASLPERGRSRTGWTAFSIQGDHPIDLGTIDESLSPDFVAGSPEIFRVATDPPNWGLVDAAIAVKAQQLLAGEDSFDRRIAIFPLAPVSACISLGYHLTSRPHLRLFQNHRDDRSWAWPRRPEPANDITVSGLENGSDSASAVTFLFHLTAPISDTDLDQIAAPHDFRIDFRVSNPSTNWLQHPEQLKWIALEARSAFERAMQLFPRATQWHLFYAGPAPIAVAAGQQINPTMYPPTQLYEYRFKENPRYKPSICLGAKPAGAT